MFAHLHVHTEYSLLDGFAPINRLLDQVQLLGMEAVAVTDHGSMFGVVEFYKEAQKRNIRPVIGCEVYTAARGLADKDPAHDKEQGHLVLLAKNNIGYQNLIKLVSMGYLEGFYYKPRIDYHVLEQYSDGLICLSACLAGDIPQLLLNEQYEAALKIALRMEKIFGKDHFFLELQDHGLEEQKRVNRQLIRLSRETGIPLVATNDVHYIRQKDSEAHDVLLCIQTGTTQEDRERMKFPNDAFFLKSEEDMRKIFPHIPEAIENAGRIAERCHVEFDFNTIHLPEYQVPVDLSLDEYLEKQCLEGLANRYPNSEPLLEERLQKELQTIFQMGYTAYFLIVWDFIRYAREKNIPVGPGRGSAAGSLVAYVLGITDVDPIKYQLIFERFLNPERVSMPDIDIDFCYERREEVIDYVKNKYGKDRVAQIITFGTMAARAAIRDVGRVINMPYGEVDQIAKMIPLAIGMTIEKAIEANPQMADLCRENKRAATLINMAKQLEGTPRHASTHAAGVVISRQPLNEHVPLYMHESSVTTQFSMGTLEELGLLKMDFLGLRTLTVIKDALDLIEGTEEEPVSFASSDYDDPAVYQLISRGDTLGVFQLESQGMVQFMKELKPSRFEDVIAGISLFRPGPMDSIPKYIRNKNHPEKVSYLHKSLEPILDVTYGCLVYQEQVMQAVRELAGYSYGHSDLVRRAMSKKKMDVMEEERQNFIYGKRNSTDQIEIEGCVSKGIPADVAGRIFDEMIDFANYAFNKSHAAAYAVLAYQTAFLKAHHPVAFMAALMTSVMSQSAKIAEYIHDCRRMKIRILPPDINHSFRRFSVEKGSIRFGMAALKNVGSGMIDQLVNERNRNGLFKDFSEFCQRMHTGDLNKRAVESLIKAGAFDSFGANRAQLMAVYEQIMDSAAKNRRNNLQGQMGLFDMVEMKSVETHDNYPDVSDFPERTRLNMEKEVLGLYISGHPLQSFQKQMKRKTSADSRDFAEIAENPLNSRLKDRQKVILGGIIVNRSMKTTRQNAMMAIIQLEDLYGVVECIVFPQVLDKVLTWVREDEIVIIKGTLDLREDEAPKVVVNDLVPAEQEDDTCHSEITNETAAPNCKLWIKIDSPEKIHLIDRVKPLFQQYQGEMPVMIYISSTKQKLMAESKLWVTRDPRLLAALEETFGPGSVKWA